VAVALAVVFDSAEDVLALRRIPRLFAWAAWAAVLCTTLALLEASFVHTDDGCVVEVHCVSCRWSYSSTVVFAPPAPVPVPAFAFAPLRPEAASRAVEAPRTRPVSRGPPLL
jgi:hypothetical protein